MLETLLFSEAQEIEAGRSLDTILEPGIYDTTGTVGGPFTDACYLLVIKPALDVRPAGTMQRAWPITGGAERTRVINAEGVWSPWLAPNEVDEVLFRRVSNANEVDMTLLAAFPSGTGTFHAQGIAAGNLGNSSTAGVLTAGNYTTQTRRNISTGPAAQTNNLCGTRGERCVSRGSAPGQGGFTFSTRWNRVTPSPNNRGFFGLFNSVNNPTATQFFATTAAWIDCIGVGYEADSGNYRLYHNDASGAPTIIDLGASFPVAVDDTYQLTLHCKANDSIIYYMLENRSTGARIIGSVNTNLPSNTAFLQMYAVVGSTSDNAQVATGWHKFHCLTPNQ